MPREWPDKPGSVGLPLPGIVMDIVALDDPRRVLAPGEKGEIRIKGPNVTKGYWNAPAGDGGGLRRRPLLTGDIGYMDEDGYFYLVDRKKDMIISGGFNVYPRTIEEAIYEHPAVPEVIVIGVPDAYRGEAAKAFVQLKRRRRRRSRSTSCAPSSPTSSAGTSCRRTGVPRRLAEDRRRQAVEEGAAQRRSRKPKQQQARNRRTPMVDAVIVSTARTPIGKAVRGASTSPTAPTWAAT